MSESQAEAKACPKASGAEDQSDRWLDRRKVQEHPCYSPEAAHAFGRIHLPVAPGCNIQCGYCVRDCDCVNESRPGVASSVLSPEEAVNRVTECVRRSPHVSVVGIAGPGEPLANEATFETFRLVAERHRELHLCVSTNGLLLPEKMEQLASVGVGNLTVTVNSVDPEIGYRIYEYVTYSGRTYRDREAAAVLMAKQLAGISASVEKGMVVKVNTVLIPGLNDGHVEDIAREMRARGVYLHNLMPLIPQHLMARVPAPSQQELRQARDRCAAIIPQMRHCRQCRADAVGRLGEGHRSACASPTT